MRILQISDTHLGMQLNCRGPAGPCRADDHHAALERALAPALRGEVDLVVHAGDVFNRSSPPRRDVLRAGALFTEVARRVPVIGIAGNHDRKGIRRWLPHRSLTFVDRPTTFDPSGLRIAVVPYRRTAEGFAAAARVAESADLLVCHQGFEGSKVPGFTFRVGRPAETVGAQHLPAGVRHIAAGHIHPRQTVEVGEATVVHGGLTERTSFSEAKQTKGAVLWEFGAEARWRFVDHDTRPMHDRGPIPTGALVRCTPDQVRSVRDRGAIAVVRGSRAR